MRMIKQAVVLLVPSLLFGIGVPAWSADSTEAPPVEAQPTTSNAYGGSLLGMLNSLRNEVQPNPAQAKQNCWSPMLYSQHDVVGDPEDCFKGRFTFGSGPSAAPALP
jgi:hypothetical protein